MRVTGGRRHPVVAALVALALGLVAAPASAGGTAVRWVDDDGLAGGAQGCKGTGMAFDSIQLAVDDSDADDIIRVCPGTYFGTVEVADRPGLVIEGVKPWKAVLKPNIEITTAPPQTSLTASARRTNEETRRLGGQGE